MIEIWCRKLQLSESHDVLIFIDHNLRVSANIMYLREDLLNLNQKSMKNFREYYRRGSREMDAMLLKWET